MSKVKQITDFQFKAGIAVIIILITTLSYFAVLQDRFRVHEDFVGEESLIKDNLNYKTEFCANRLTELAHEIHFLEKEILLKKDVLGKEKLIQEQEEGVIKIEQRELQTVKQEFETYTKICDQFDENPTPELCAIFLKESKEHLEAAQKNADESIGIRYIEITIKDLRNAHRIYEGMQGVCNNK